ncbi:MAG: TonB-dependent receptor [Legionella sp.]|uniref:TonB-dependent receptor n=1 Tax=Legionella sp. TaxID=459 RepID=UPI0039E617D5
MKKPPSFVMTKIFPILATTGAMFISNSSFAETQENISASENTIQQLETLKFTASRTDEIQEKSKQITKIDEKRLELLKQGSSGNIATVLARAVPGLADSSRTITDFGQTLRGRNALILVDGIPLNLSRETSRGLSGIDAESIKNIEVIRGSNAIYGGGATGGIISITTKSAGGKPSARTVVGFQTPLTNFRRDALSADVHHYFSGSLNAWDYALDFGYKRTGGSYDASGDRIAPEPSQGDLFDSDAYSVGGKLGYHIDDNQYIQFSANYYTADQDSDYVSDPSVASLAAGSVPARAIKGLKLADQNQNESQLYNLTYKNKDLLGSSFDSQVYYRDFYTRFNPTDGRNQANRGNTINQGYQENKVLGGRLTFNTPLHFLGDSTLVWGGDFIREQSEMPLDTFDPEIYDQSGGLEFVKNGNIIYLPKLTTQSAGVFAQLKHRFNDQWSAEIGTRYENSFAEVGDFIPLTQLNSSNPYTVTGGKVKADAWLYNASVTFSPVKQHSFYASFSQGFQLPDVGLVIRNANTGFNLGSSFLEPVKVDNYELGWNGSFDRISSSIAVFYSTSDLGAVQSFNNGLSLARTKEKVTGVEATLDYLTEDEVWGVGGSVTWMRGRETPQGQSEDQKMTGYRIPPLKLTSYISYSPSDTWTNRLQATYFGSRDYRLNGREALGRYDAKTYTTVDLMSSFDVNAKNNVSIGLENIFNRKYYPLYSQLLRSNNNMSHLLASGITLKVTYSYKW